MMFGVGDGTGFGSKRIMGERWRKVEMVQCGPLGVVQVVKEEGGGGEGSRKKRGSPR
jgi:hypothetical protein